jgi:hypothetical protein
MNLGGGLRHACCEGTATMKITSLLLIVVSTFLLTGVASAQERPATVAPAELICFDTLDAGATVSLLRQLIRGAASIEADHQTNCLVVSGITDTAPLRRIVAALEDRARTHPRVYSRRDGDQARAPARSGGNRSGDRGAPRR